MKLVVTGNREEFLWYCNENKLNPHDNHVVKWIRERPDMFGYRGVEVVFYGTYYKLKDIHDIEYEAERIIKMFEYPKDR